jgi:hypothetical protein
MIYTLSPVESGDLSLVMLESMKNAIRKLFGINFTLKNGFTVADNTKALLNTRLKVFPEAVTLQCYAHVHMKYKTKDNKTGVLKDGDYKDLIFDKKANLDTCFADVRKLHACK